VCSQLGTFVQKAYCSGDSDVPDRIVAVLDTGLHSKDGFAFSCVAVAFLESEAWHAPEPQKFVDTWPDGIRSKLRRSGVRRHDARGCAARLLALVVDAYGAQLRRGRFVG